MNTQINGNDLLAIGYEQSEALGIALKINKKRLGFSREQMMENFKNVLESPENYLDDKNFSKLASALIEKANQKPEDFISLNQTDRKSVV